MFHKLTREFRKQKNPEKSLILQRFFKTGPGEYGNGDKFHGIVVPITRKFSKKYIDLSMPDLEKLIQSKWHEERLLALLILVLQYQRSQDLKTQKKIYQFYIKHQKFINNWDLVDLTAPHIVGHYLFDKDKSVLTNWANSTLLWRRRVAALATFYFIRQNQFNETLKLAKQLINDKEDLIHKSVGWMLREVGKRDVRALENFLNKYSKKMPCTMLRYAIERFPEKKRKGYLIKG